MQLMSIEDLASYLGDSKRTIYKYIAGGDCPPYIKISSKNIKFDRADVDAWLESKKVFPDSGEKDMIKIIKTDYVNDIIKKVAHKSKLPWTPKAQAVLKQAQMQARKDGFGLLGTEHVLFGIISVNDCLGARILKNLGVTFAMCYQQYEQSFKKPDQKATGKVKVTEDITKLIKCSYEQASQWKHEYIGAEHLLSGILLAGTGMGFQILTDLDVTLQKVYEETAKLIVCNSVSTE